MEWVEGRLVAEKVAWWEGEKEGVEGRLKGGVEEETERGWVGGLPPQDLQLVTYMEGVVWPDDNIVA